MVRASMTSLPINCADNIESHSPYQPSHPASSCRISALILVCGVPYPWPLICSVPPSPVASILWCVGLPLKMTVNTCPPLSVLRTRKCPSETPPRSAKSFSACVSRHSDTHPHTHTHHTHAHTHAHTHDTVGRRKSKCTTHPSHYVPSVRTSTAHGWARIDTMSKAQ